MGVRKHGNTGRGKPKGSPSVLLRAMSYAEGLAWILASPSREGFEQRIFSALPARHSERRRDGGSVSLENPVVDPEVLEGSLAEG